MADGKPNRAGRPADRSRGMGEAQAVYARLMSRLAGAGLAGALLGFALYLAGFPPARVPPALLPGYWRLPLADYLARAGAPTGWGWLALLGRGDYLAFPALVFLNLVPLACYLRIVPVLRRHGLRRQLLVVVLQALVFLACASGLLRRG